DGGGRGCRWAGRRSRDGGGTRPAHGRRRERRLMRIERRLRRPGWLTVVVPVVSILLAFVLSAIVLLLTGHPPLKSFHRLFDAAFIANGALTETVVSAT